jgi:PAS domain S-box-containing protein
MPAAAHRPAYRSGRRLRDALPHPQEYSCLLTPDAFLARVSPDLERDFGRATHALHGHPFLDLVHEDDQVAVRAALSWLKADAKPVVFECRWQHHDGNWRWLEWTVVRRPGETVLPATARDVTRWREDEALAVGQARVLERIVAGAPLPETLDLICSTLEAATERLKAAIYRVERATNRLELAAAPSFDPGLRSVLQTQTLDSGPGAAVAATRHESLVASGDLVSSTLWTGQPDMLLARGVRAEWALAVRDGSVVVAVMSGYLSVSGDPTPRDRQAFATAADLARQALASSSGLREITTLSTALAAAGDVIAVLAVDGTISWVNAAFERRLGAMAGDVSGHALNVLAGPDSDRTAFERIQRAMQQGTPVQQDILAAVRGGSPIWLELDISPTRTAEGRVSGWVLVGRDVTGPKLAEEALARSEEHVQRALAAAGMGTLEWDAERRALDCSETLGPLFGLPHGAGFESFEEALGLAHPDDRDGLEHFKRSLFRSHEPQDFSWRVRLPDGTERWLRARLRAELDASGHVRRVAGVIAEAEEPLGVAEPVFAEPALAAPAPGEPVPTAAGHPPAPSTPPSPSAIDLSSLVATWSVDFRAETAASASLHLRLAPDEVSVFGDPPQLRESILALVRNAAEALDGGGVISLATGTVDASRAFLASAFFDDGLPAGRYAYVEVSDTGRGMDAATVARIFDPGFSTRSPDRGLGLPRVLGIVREHHGAVQVYSKPDIGTTVRILIPTEILMLSGRVNHPADDADPTRERILALSAHLRAAYSSSEAENK